MCIVMQKHSHREGTRDRNVWQQSVLEGAVSWIHPPPCCSSGYARYRDCSLETAYDTGKDRQVNSTGLSYSRSHQISADQYWVPFDEHLFQQYQSASTTSDSSPRSLLYSLLLLPHHALEPFFFCSISHLHLLLGSLHLGAPQAAYQAQLSMDTYRSVQQMETWVTGPSLQKQALPPLFW